MTAVVESPPPAGSPAWTADEPRRLVRISANLLPAEVVGDRRLAALKRRLAAALFAVVILLGAGYGYSRWQTSHALDALQSAQNEADAVLAQQSSYARLVNVQAELATVQQELAGVMTNDMEWSRLLGALSDDAPPGVTITGVTGAVTGAGGATSGSGSASYVQVLNRTGRSTVGTLTVSGTAPSKAAVAAYVDALAKQRGLAALYPSSVSGDHASWTFTLAAQLTEDVLGGRFSAPSTTNGTP